MTPGVAAPTTKLSPSSRMPIMPGIRFASTITSGRTRPDFSWTRRSVPPDSTFATPPLAANALTASSIDVGAVKLTLGMFAPGKDALAARRHRAKGGPARHGSGLHYHPRQGEVQIAEPLRAPMRHLNTVVMKAVRFRRRPRPIPQPLGPRLNGSPPLCRDPAVRLLD